MLDDFNFLAFDVIGSLAFGEPFGMVDREADIVMVENEKGQVSEVRSLTQRRADHCRCPASRS